MSIWPGNRKQKNKKILDAYYDIGDYAVPVVNRDVSEISFKPDGHGGYKVEVRYKDGLVKGNISEHKLEYLFRSLRAFIGESVLDPLYKDEPKAETLTKRKELENPSAGIAGTYDSFAGTQYKLDNGFDLGSIVP